MPWGANHDDLIAGYTGILKDEIDFTAAGINHMAWFLELRHNGEDIYPVLRETMERPTHFMNENHGG